MSLTCPLCLSENIKGLALVRDRKFHLCSNCNFIFLNPRFHLNRKAELERYKFHQNNIEDAGYLKFIGPLIGAVNEFIPSEAEGFDYGSGPNPVCTKLLTDCGYQMKNYDPFFAKNDSALRGKYDFVVCCEVAEHFSKPAEEFAQLKSLLKRNGILFVMTLRPTPKTDFSSWHYARDNTHISFYSEIALKWIQNHWQFSEIKFLNDRLALLRN